MSGSNYGVSYAKLSYYGVIPASTGYELYHHGRKGQKWGKRNGPPYPLTREKVSFAYGAKKVAKAIGRGASTTVKSIGRGAKAAGRGVRKAAIRFNLMPRKLMTEKELVDRMKRIQKENDLAHLQGKLTKLDRLEIDNENRRRRKQMISDAVGKTLAAIGTQALPGIIKDAVSKRKGYGDYEESKVAEREANSLLKKANAAEKELNNRAKEEAMKNPNKTSSDSNNEKKDNSNNTSDKKDTSSNKGSSSDSSSTSASTKTENKPKREKDHEMTVAEAARDWDKNRKKYESADSTERDNLLAKLARDAAEATRRREQREQQERVAKANEENRRKYQEDRSKQVAEERARQEAQEKHDKRSQSAKDGYRFRKFKEAAEKRYEDRGAKNVTVSGNTISYTNAYGERVTHDLREIFRRYFK